LNGNVGHLGSIHSLLETREPVQIYTDRILIVRPELFPYVATDGCRRAEYEVLVENYAPELPFIMVLLVEELSTRVFDGIPAILWIDTASLNP
jgi:hypothetical protein